MDELKKKFAINALRRASYRWPGRYQAAKRAHIGRNQYKCESCNGTFTKNEIQLDHIDPVVDPERGFVGFDEWIDRMFAYSDGWSTKCKPCHQVKTQAENEIRRQRGTKDESGSFKKKTKKKVDKTDE